MTTYTIYDRYRFEIEKQSDTIEDAKQAAKQWVLGGDWGVDGANVEVYIHAADDDEPIISIIVEVPPDEEHLIHEAMYGTESCGDSPNDHEWEHDGTWSSGGTSTTTASHCRRCGLHRVWRVCGSQQNPDEHDTVTYSASMADEL